MGLSLNLSCQTFGLVSDKSECQAPTTVLESGYSLCFSSGRYVLLTKSQGVTIHRPIVYGNTATVLSPEEKASLHYPDHTHRWTVAVRSAASAPDSDIVGGADDMSYFIKRVTFKLHETYPNPTRSR